MKEAEKIIGAGNPEKRKAHDFYPTPADVTYALLDLLDPILSPKTCFWECACGEGDMVNAIFKRGYSVFGTDIACGDGYDFLTCTPPEGVNWIITNPPFTSSEAFIRRAYSLGLPFAFLLKSQYWHAHSRYALFNACKPDIIAPLTWRPDFRFKEDGKHGASLMDVMWCVWLPGFLRTGMTQYIPLERKNR